MFLILKLYSLPAGDSLLYLGVTSWEAQAYNFIGLLKILEPPTSSGHNHKSSFSLCLFQPVAVVPQFSAQFGAV